jgi:hypothetical protein
MPDILTKIAQRVATPAKKLPALVKRWQVATRTRIGSKLYTYAKARRIVARAKRMGVDAYIAGSLAVRL